MDLLEVFLKFTAQESKSKSKSKVNIAIRSIFFLYLTITHTLAREFSKTHKELKESHAQGRRRVGLLDDHLVLLARHFALQVALLDLFAKNLGTVSV